MIDIHTHYADKTFFADIFLEGFAENSYKLLTEDLKKLTNVNFLKRIISGSLQDKKCTKLIKQMDEANIDKSALMIVDFFYDNRHPLSLEEIFIEHYKIKEHHKNRFFVFAGIDPRRGKEGIDLFEKSLKEYSFDGLKLYPPCGFELHDEILFPFYELCETYHVPVLSHMGPSINRYRDYSNFMESVLKITKQFKKVKFILGHTGILFFNEAMEISTNRKNIFIEVSGFQHQEEEKEYITHCMKEFFLKVPHQILFGTDWPMFNMKRKQKTWVDYFLNLKGINNNQFELFFNKNAEYVLSRME